MVKNENGTYTFTEEETAQLVQGNLKAKEYLEDIYTLRDAVMKTCHAFKITTPDGKNIRRSILDKTENPIKSLASGGIAFVGNMTMAAAGIKAAQDELKNSFGHLVEMGPILEKYGGQGQQLILSPETPKQLDQ